MFFYQVALLRSSAPSLTYHSHIELQKGMLVIVPFQKSAKEAVIIEKVEKPSFETVEVSTVSERYYNPTQMELARFIAEYYFSSFGEAISLFLPFRKQREVRNEEIYHQEKEIEALQSNANHHSSLITHHSSLKRPALSNLQQQAYAALLHKARALLFGVTGAGKTEIFISLMAKMLSEGKSSIFLMPEISLTPQMEKRLKAYFGEQVAMWHSKLTKKKKESILEGIYSGKVRIVAGARSALFVPLQDLGLIVVDEEHDDSYKAMTRPRYHARDVAVLMGQRSGAQVILASATPSAGSYHKYDVVKLDKPYVETKKTYHFISGDRINPPILKAIGQNLKAHGQSLLFLPTRGNFKYLYCQHCGRTHLCPYCSVGMALHRNKRHLKCHYCNFTEPIRDTCIYCGHQPLTSERMGTAEAIEVIEGAVEDIKIEQFDKDSITTAKKLKEALERFESGESNLLLGTQMLSKGHDYANITLSVIMGLDYILGLADYRSRERAMSLFLQIAGRSGRAREAEVIVQTGDAAFFEQYLDDYEQFIKDELVFLKMAHYPPFVSLARILIGHKDPNKASKVTEETVAKLKAYKEVEIVGHGKAPIEKIAGKYRFTILLRSKTRTALLKALHSVQGRELEIDMDPVEFS
ncbi:MAG: primosomal protein N' [Campylobacterales bacterium]|nr:primosomal protein N' [Campylobacterales bacterium]